jgi:short-subunit dehydrogenase
MRDTYLITGASAGLGAGFATELARAGHDVILVARRAGRLRELATLLQERHGITATAIDSDLTEAGAVAKLMDEIGAAGLTVTHLINNAGYGLRGEFAELDGPSQARMIDLNCRALVELCHAVLPGMLAAKRGGILNVASTAAFQPGPWMAVYYASKAFVLSFSEALHHEVRDKGVSVAALCPGATRTEFFDVADMRDSALSKFLAGKPEKVVRDGLKALAGNKAVSVSGALNATIAGSIRFTPRPLARRIAGSLQKARR